MSRIYSYAKGRMVANLSDSAAWLRSSHRAT